MKLMAGPGASGWHRNPYPGAERRVGVRAEWPDPRGTLLQSVSTGPQRAPA